MAAAESAEFARWTATTNVDDQVLDQMDADIVEMAQRFLADPPAAVFAQLLDGRNTLFELITAGRQPPRLTMRLYKAAGQVCAMLAHASNDLGFGHAAIAQARVAQRCADYAEHSGLTAYVTWVQSNVLYWEGRHNDAAELVGSALSSTSRDGTAQLRLASQLARIEAARGNHSQVRDALRIAEQAGTEPTADEPGVMAFSPGKSAYYASEAYRGLGGPADLASAVRWAQTAVEIFSSSKVPSTSLTAAAYFDLARAHLAAGDFDASGEQMSRAISTTDEYRTVPVIERARSLRDLFGSSGQMHDQLDAFCLAPALAPSELPGSDESPT